MSDNDIQMVMAKLEILEGGQKDLKQDFKDLKQDFGALKEDFHSLSNRIDTGLMENRSKIDMGLKETRSMALRLFSFAMMFTAISMVGLLGKMFGLF